jgi:hypothetical protein
MSESLSRTLMVRLDLGAPGFVALLLASLEFVDDRDRQAADVELGEHQDASPSAAAPSGWWSS